MLTACSLCALLDMRYLLDMTYVCWHFGTDKRALLAVVWMCQLQHQCEGRILLHLGA
jgi:hypothetical protein